MREIREAIREVKALPGIDETAAQERAKILTSRSSKGQAKREGIALAISLLDLTSLEGSDTKNSTIELATRASNPGNSLPHCAAICIYPDLIGDAKNYLQSINSKVKVAAVGGGFPHGKVSLEVKLKEIEQSLILGADEIDMVIDRGAFLGGNWEKVFQDIHEIKKLTSSHKAILKVILETGELGSLDSINQAASLAILAGADFIKTSTGKIPKASTPASTLVLLRASQRYHESTGLRVGVKPAGGIRTTTQALGHLQMAKEITSNEQLTSSFYRFGASALLTDLLMQWDKMQNGGYSSVSYIPGAAGSY